MPNDHRGRDVHGGKVTDDVSYSFSADDILGAFDPYQETKLRTLGYEQDDKWAALGLSSARFATSPLAPDYSSVTVPDLPPGGDWPVVRNPKQNTHKYPYVTSSHSLGQSDLSKRMSDSGIGKFRRHPVGPPPTTSGERMHFWDTASPSAIGTQGAFRTPYRAALAATAMSKRAADPTRNLRTGRKMDNV